MNRIDYGTNTQAWLDRLVCGELDEASRSGLLAWLDAEPLRWRACGVAFLEAQTWNESLSTVAVEEHQVRIESVEIRKDRQSRNRVSAWAILAPSLLVAFVLGTVARGWISPTREASVAEKGQLPSAPGGPLMASVSLQPKLGSPMGATIQIPVLPVQQSGGAEGEKVRPLSEYERQKWERRGYVLTKERRFLPAQLPNGKKVAVPVEQVKASYVGSKVS